MGKWWRRLLRWVFGLPTIQIAADPLTSAEHGQHVVEFVSRHSIAETGLICPSCGTEVVSLGDYSQVCRSRLGEVIRCNGKRTIQDEEHVCGKLLVASPDTEHGDNILWDHVPRQEREQLFYRFVRIAEGDIVKRKYGADVCTKEGQLVATNPGPSAPVAAKQKLKLAAGQTWMTDIGKIVEIISVQTDGDPYYQGWGKCRFQNEEGFEWHVDCYGKIRQSMRDPTMNDHGQLTTEVRRN